MGVTQIAIVVSRVIIRTANDPAGMSSLRFGPPDLTRRHLLTATAATIAVTAGCNAFGGPRYTLRSRPKDGAHPTELFVWEPRPRGFHYRWHDGYVDALAEELYAGGRVESVEFPLVEERPTGEDGYAPTYAHYDGRFDRIEVRSEPVSLDRWVVWMEPLESFPDGVDYVSDPEEPYRVPTDGLSSFDAAIVEEATSAALRSVVGDRDHATRRASDRGVVFFDPLEPAESDLLSDPPFEYALIEPEGHGTPDELALRLHATEESVETTRYIHGLRPVAESESAFVTHVRSEHVAVEYGDSAPSEETAEIFSASTNAASGPDTYTEEAPPSEAFERVIDDLGLADAAIPDGREVASWLRHYEYRGNYYEARFRISDI